MPLAVPVLAVADNEDATGVVATITGSDVASTNTLYRSSVSGELEAGTWTSSGSCTGDDTIAVAITTLGYYFWYVQSVSGGESTISNLVYQAITDGEQAVLTRCIAAVVSRLQLLTLSGIATDRIVAVADISNPGTTPNYPCVLVAREPTPHQYLGGTNIRDDIGYPIQVLFCESDDLGGQSDTARWDLWRQQAERAFRFVRLPGVAESQLASEIEPLKILDPQFRPPIYNKVVSGFTIRVMTREVRGLGA